MPDADCRALTGIVVQLDRLLAAARAGTTALSSLVQQAPTPEMASLLSQIRDDGASACAGLAECLARLGHRPAQPERGPHEKVLAVPALPDRIRLLNRAQRWVVDWLDEVLRSRLDTETRALLVEMRAINLRNVRRCDDLLVELDRQREVAHDLRSHGAPP